MKDPIQGITEIKFNVGVLGYYSMVRSNGTIILVAKGQYGNGDESVLVKKAVGTSLSSSDRASLADKMISKVEKHCGCGMTQNLQSHVRFALGLLAA